MRIYPHPTHAGWYVVDIPPRKGQKRERPVFGSYDEAVKYSNALSEVTPQATVHPRIGDVVESYLEWVKDKQAERTYHNKEIRFRKHIIPFFAPYRVKDVTQTLLDRYSKGKKESCYLTDLVFFMALVTWMVKRKHADKLAFEPEIPKIERKIKHIPSPAEILTLCDAIPVEMHKVMALLMLFTGMRIMEVRQLKWEDYQGNAFTCRHTKTKQQYIQPIPENIRPWFTAHQQKTGFVFQSPYKPNQPVVDIFHSLKKASEQTGIKMTAHTFRHAAATFTYEQTGDIYAVQQLLRHSKISQSTIYARFSAERRQSIMNNLANYINDLSNMTTNKP